ncbi:Cysteine--tRNA ligase [Candidatus Norongarragalina meridionalis]|nr:Cysteine--tRNA ligase [Candidatus Norongarragalina meridionalis]
MALQFYNTLSRRKEKFEPLRGKKIGLYSCGPTVYNFAHIGNLRSYVFVDLLKRYLEWKGYAVTHVMNVTDVDDKTIRGAKQEGVPLRIFTERYEKAFFDDLSSLNVEPATVYPRATEHVGGMIKLIQKLLDDGIAYKKEDGVYFAISSFKKYGALSHLNRESLKSGASGVRADEYAKDAAADFALWKAWDAADGDVFWEAPFGRGRPGWHIECSAMSSKYLGDSFDIHTGGVDLVFPHHENEIAQSEAVSGKKFVKYWMHCEHLMVDGRKMAKSLGNFYTLRDIEERKGDAMALRYLLISTHYRSQLNFTFDALEQAKNTVDSLNDFAERLREAKGKGDPARVADMVAQAKRKFEAYMDDDLNVAYALTVVFDFVHEANKMLAAGEMDRVSAKEALAFIEDVDRVLGVLSKRKKRAVSAEVRELVDGREAARKKGDFKEADRLRAALREKGVVLEDSKEGVRIKWLDS